MSTMSSMLAACARGNCIALGLLLLTPTPNAARQIFSMAEGDNLPHPHIAVSATGTVPVPPDRATLYFTLQIADSVPAVAIAEVTELRDRLERAVLAFGVPGESVTTWGFGAGQQSGWSNRPAPTPSELISGFRSRMGVRVVLDSLEVLSSVVSAALSAGEVALPLVTFEARNVAAARGEAVARAVASAMRDAAALAEAAGGELGELLFLRSAQSPDLGNQLLSLYQNGPTFQTPLQPSDVTVRMMVSAAWRVRQ